MSHPPPSSGRCAWQLRSPVFAHVLDSSFCSVGGGASLLYLAAVVCAPKFSKMFILSATFSTSFLPYPRSCLVFCSRDVGSAVPPRVAPSIFRLRGESGSYSQAPLPPPAFRGGTVLYCTVLYASFDVMVVGTNNLTCGFNCQCTADDIGYAVMITARLDSLPSPQSLSRFGSTPAGKQPGSKTEDWDRNGPQKMPVVSSSLCFPPVCCLLYNNGKTQIMWYTRPGSSEVPCNL